MARNLSHLLELPVLVDMTNDRPILIIGSMDHGGEMHSICIDHDEHTDELSIGLMPVPGEAEMRSRFHVSDMCVTREEVIAMYRMLRQNFQSLTPLEAARVRLIDTCDSIVSEMIYQEAKMSPEPIQYLKRWYQSGLQLPALEQIMDTVFDALAEHMLRHRCAQRIQRRFRCVISDPYHPVCQRRLMHEYHALSYL